MRKSLQSIFLTGLMTAGGLMLHSVSHAQQEYYWGNPDIPYIDQRGFSLGMTIGMSDLWADVGTKSVMDHYFNDNYTGDIMDNMRFMGGMFFRYNHVPGIAFRLSINYGSLYATDAWNEEKGLEAANIQDDAYQRYVRNLDVSNNIWEGSLLFEFSPLQVGGWEFSKLAKSRVQPYLMVGVAGFHFNPQGTYKNLTTGQSSLVDLQPLHTEGQNFQAPGATFPENYNLWSYAAVGGLGVRFDIGKGLGLGLEYQLRYTFTDYLDDVSGQYIDPLHFDIGYLNESGKNASAWKMADRSNEIIPGYRHQPGEYRGNPDNNDMYSTVSVMFFWRIKKRATPWWN